MNCLKKSLYLSKYKIIGILFITIFGMLLGMSYNHGLWANNRVEDPKEEIVIGVLSFDSKKETMERWQPLAEYLTAQISDRSFNIMPLTYLEFDRVLHDHVVDYILTNPAHFIAMGQKFELSGAIATLTELSNGEPQSGFGGVIFTRNSDEMPTTIEEIKNRKVSAVNQNSLGGYQASAYELYKAGVLDQVEFVLTGMPHKNTIKMVLSGEADVGFVRSGVIEGLIESGELEENALKIINPQKLDRFTQHLSTTLYPEWPFIAMNHIDPEDAQKVAAALFLLHESEAYTEQIGISGFTIPASYLPVEDMMRVLKIPPFDMEDSITLERLWDTYPLQIITGLILLIGICFYALNRHLTGRLLSQKNVALNELTDELQRVNNKLQNLAIRDTLTGLYNRRYFEDFLETALESACKEERTLAICIIDVDHFKHFNDDYGHWVGDQVLTAVAHTLNSQKDEAIKLVARFAGDEFIIILDDVTPESSELIASRILKNMATLKVKIQGLEEILTVTITMGIALSQQPNCRDSNELFKAADRALLKAKDSGKNCYRVN